MDSTAELVQTYLRVNGYFTVADYPVIESVADEGYRTVTDLDLLAFRFPHAGRLIPGRDPSSGEAQFEPDRALGLSEEEPDLLIGEIKRGRAHLNRGARDPNVIRVALHRFGCCPHASENLVERLLKEGSARLPTGHCLRLIAFGSEPPDREVNYRVILLDRVLDFLRSYIRQHWDILKQTHFRDPAFEFLMTLEKIGRGRTEARQ